MYKFLADAVVFVHLLIVLALFSGPIIFFKSKEKQLTKLQKAYIVLVGVTITTQAIFEGCPLTLIEKTLRMQYDPSLNYQGTFIVQKLAQVGISLENTAVIAGFAIVILLCIGIYLTFGLKGKTTLGE